MTPDASWVDDMPQVYDDALGPSLFAPWAGLVAAAAAVLAPRRVLELAAGTGIATAALVRALPGAQVTATDLNAAMVAHGARRVPAAVWRQADAQCLDDEDASADLVVCQFGAMFFPDRPGAYAEAAQIVAPGGSLLLAVWDDIAGSTFTAALVSALTAVLPDRTPDFVARVPHGYGDPLRIAADLAAGGLGVRSCERLVPRGQAPSVRRLAEGFCLGTPLRSALQERGPLADLVAAVSDELVARLGPGPLEGDLAGFLVRAVRAPG